jgi:hypothetical protein
MVNKIHEKVTKLQPGMRGANIAASGLQTDFVKIYSVSAETMINDEFSYSDE